MESTGVYWKPIYNIMEGKFTLLLVNARHVKNVPGRKTDVKDCQWLAQLLQCGLLKGSFVPEKAQREFRDLTRHRIQLTNERSAVANRIHKVLEDANIKLGAVATDILGKSGRDMIDAFNQGKNEFRRDGRPCKTAAQGENTTALPGSLKATLRTIIVFSLSNSRSILITWNLRLRHSAIESRSLAALSGRPLMQQLSCPDLRSIVLRT